MADPQDIAIERNREQPMAEARQFNRFRSHQLVNVADEHGTEITNIRDFSVRGVCFFISHQVIRDAPVTLLLNMYMPNATRLIAADAKVAWTGRVGRRGPYMIGAEFTRIAAEDRAYLRQLIDHMRAEYRRAQHSKESKSDS